jgi:hypothetical protein
MGLIIGSSCGLFNNCWCWSGVYTFGKSKAAMYMNPVRQFDFNDHTIYPALVAACFVLQFYICGWMLWIEWSGFKVMWWNEEEKQAELLVRRLAPNSNNENPTMPSNGTDVTGTLQLKHPPMDSSSSEGCQNQDGENAVDMDVGEGIDEEENVDDKSEPIINENGDYNVVEGGVLNQATTTR